MKNKQNIVIFGTSGFALELAELFKNNYNIIGFIGPSPKIKLPFKYIGTDSKIKSIASNVKCIVAIGDIKTRIKVYTKIKNFKKKIASLIHPNSYFNDGIKIPQGLICYPHSTIHSGVKIGFGTVINSNTTIGHQTIIKQYVNISPGVTIGGNCIISNQVHLGIGSTLSNNIKIYNDAYIGAGSLVIKHITKKGLYVGSPAKFIK